MMENWKARIKRFISARDGAGAVEFAFIAPILIAVYISSFEVTVGMNLSRKVSKTAGTLADIVTQQSSVDKAFLATMIDAARSNLAPYEPSTLTIKITGIRIDNLAHPKVLWSWDQSGGRPYLPGAAVAGLPAELTKANSFVVKAEVSVPHTMLLFLSSTIQTEARTLTISKDYYFRQRLGAEVACSNC